MAKVNSCLKKVFICFNVLFALLGAVIVAIAVFGHAYYSDTEQFGNQTAAIVLMYVVGASTTIIALLGAVGAYRESKCLLIAFFVCMSVGVGVLLRFSIPAVIHREQVMTVVEEQLKRAVPLDEAEINFQQTAEVLQEKMSCCGLFNGYQDWGQHVPDSCFCVDGTSDCEEVTIPRNSQLLGFGDVGHSHERHHRKKFVHAQVCGPIIVTMVAKAVNIVLGVCFGLAALALLGAMLSIILLAQIRSLVRGTPTIFLVNSPPPKYTELVNEH